MVPSSLLHTLKHDKCKIGKFPDKFLELGSMWLFVWYPLSMDALSVRSLRNLSELFQNSAKWLVYQMVSVWCLCLFKCFSNDKKKSNIPYLFWALYIIANSLILLFKCSTIILPSLAWMSQPFSQQPWAHTETHKDTHTVRQSLLEFLDTNLNHLQSVSKCCHDILKEKDTFISVLFSSSLVLFQILVW